MSRLLSLLLLALLALLVSSQTTCPCKEESFSECPVPDPANPGACTTSECFGLVCVEAGDPTATGNCVFSTGSYFVKTGDGANGAVTCELQAFSNIPVPDWSV